MTNHLNNKVCAAAACKSISSFLNHYTDNDSMSFICRILGLNPIFYTEIDKVSLNDTFWCLGMDNNTGIDNDAFSSQHTHKVSGENSSNVLTPLE